MFINHNLCPNKHALLSSLRVIWYSHRLLCVENEEFRTRIPTPAHNDNIADSHELSYTHGTSTELHSRDKYAPFLTIDIQNYDKLCALDD